PEGAQRVGLVLAMLQARQIWAGPGYGGGGLPGLREALGLAEDGQSSRATVDRAEELARALVEGMELAGWRAGAAQAVTDDVLGTWDQEDRPGTHDQRGVPGARGEAVARVLR